MWRPTRATDIKHLNPRGSLQSSSISLSQSPIMTGLYTAADGKMFSWLTTLVKESPPANIHVRGSMAIALGDIFMPAMKNLPPHFYKERIRDVMQDLFALFLCVSVYYDPEINLNGNSRQRSNWEAKTRRPAVGFGIERMAEHREANDWFELMGVIYCQEALDFCVMPRERHRIHRLLHDRHDKMRLNRIKKVIRSSFMCFDDEACQMHLRSFKDAWNANDPRRMEAKLELLTQTYTSLCNGSNFLLSESLAGWPTSAISRKAKADISAGDAAYRKFMKAVRGNDILLKPSAPGQASTVDKATAFSSSRPASPSNHVDASGKTRSTRVPVPGLNDTETNVDPQTDRSESPEVLDSHKSSTVLDKIPPRAIRRVTFDA